MTLNGAMALLRYFTEFVYDAVVKRLFFTSVSSLLLTVYDHFTSICAIIQRLFALAYAPVSWRVSSIAAARPTVQYGGLYAMGESTLTLANLAVNSENSV